MLADSDSTLRRQRLRRGSQERARRRLCLRCLPGPTACASAPAGRQKGRLKVAELAAARSLDGQRLRTRLAPAPQESAARRWGLGGCRWPLEPVFPPTPEGVPDRLTARGGAGPRSTTPKKGPGFLSALCQLQGRLSQQRLTAKRRKTPAALPVGHFRDDVEWMGMSNQGTTRRSA